MGNISIRVCSNSPRAPSLTGRLWLLAGLDQSDLRKNYIFMTWNPDFIKGLREPNRKYAKKGLHPLYVKGYRFPTKLGSCFTHWQAAILGLNGDLRCLARLLLLIGNGQLALLGPRSSLDWVLHGKTNKSKHSGDL